MCLLCSKKLLNGQVHIYQFYGTKYTPTQIVNTLIIIFWESYSLTGR